MFFGGFSVWLEKDYHIRKLYEADAYHQITYLLHRFKSPIEIREEMKVTTLEQIKYLLRNNKNIDMF